MQKDTIRGFRGYEKVRVSAPSDPDDGANTWNDRRRQDQRRFAYWGNKPLDDLFTFSFKHCMTLVTASFWNIGSMYSGHKELVM